jgi:ABC-type bacteriocin/lantibiotic exporter with double-glycine peptidase domain
MPNSLYAFIWQESRRSQIWLCLLTLCVVPLSMVPLELQRRMVDDALASRSVAVLLPLAGAYLGIILLHGGLKYLLNVYRGRVIETTVRRLREIIYAGSLEQHVSEMPMLEVERGGLVSMVAAEAEDVGGFVGESISLPLLQGGTIVAVLGYLAWVQPLIAGVAVALYLPQLFVVRWGQGRINRFARAHAKLVRKLGDHIVIIGPAAPPGGNPMRRFMRIAGRAFDARIAIYRLKFFLTFFGNFLDALGPLVVLLFGGWLVIHGRAEISTLVVFISGIQRVADPWDQLISFYRTAANAGVKYRLILESVRQVRAATGTTEVGPATPTTA